MKPLVYTDEKIVQEQKASGLTVQKYCEDNEIGVTTYYKATKRIKR